GVEHRLTVLVAVVGQGDLVTEQVAGGRDALADQQTGGGQAVEELLRGCGAGGGAAHGLAQFLTRGALAAFPLGFVTFGAGGPLGGGAVAGVEAAQPVVDLDLAGFGLGAFAVLAEAGLAAVLADDGGDDVDVVVGVPDGRPAAGGVVAVGGDTGGGDHPAGYLAPLLVRQD